ncbi:hypothetical protein [Roseateles sp. P5_D6]
MKLVPANPPGRSTRKARGYADDIRTLRAQGYTFEAIREALAAVGVQVSNRTVQREAARPAHYLSTTTQQVHENRPYGKPAPTGAEDAPVAPSDAVHSTGGPSGKDVAEAFRKRHIANPLIRAKEQR